MTRHVVTIIETIHHRIVVDADKPAKAEAIADNVWMLRGYEAFAHSEPEFSTASRPAIYDDDMELPHVTR